MCGLLSGGGRLQGVWVAMLGVAVGPQSWFLLRLRCRCGFQTYGDAPPPSANLLVLISQCADKAAETLSSTDVTGALLNKCERLKQL